MNLVDVNPKSSPRAVLWRNIRHSVIVIGGTIGLIALAYWFLFAVLIPHAQVTGYVSPG